MLSKKKMLLYIYSLLSILFITNSVQPIAMAEQTQAKLEAEKQAKKLEEEMRPKLAELCKTGQWIERLNEEGYRTELCEKEFDFFENYSFAFNLPEKILSYPYPLTWATHGVVVPLGPLKKEEENRDLLVWASFNLAEDDDMKILALDVQLKNHLRYNEEKMPRAYDKAIFSKETHDGTTFLCFSTEDNNLFKRECLGLNVNKTIIYDFSLSSTDQHKAEDLAYFDKVIKTFESKTLEEHTKRIEPK